MFSVLKSESVTEKDIVRIVLILERPYDFLEKQFQNAFEGQSGTMVLVNRRHGERRQKKELFSPERRQTDRRASQGKIGSAIISG